MTQDRNRRAQEVAQRTLDAVNSIRAIGTSKNADGYGAPFGAPWHIVDTSKAELEVNWPGELIETV